MNTDRLRAVARALARHRRPYNARGWRFALGIEPGAPTPSDMMPAAEAIAACAATLAGGAGDETAARQWLGLTAAEARNLFNPRWPRQWFERARVHLPSDSDFPNPTADEAAVILKAMAATGRVWPITD